MDKWTMQHVWMLFRSNRNRKVKSAASLASHQESIWAGAFVWQTPNGPSQDEPEKVKQKAKNGGKKIKEPTFGIWWTDREFIKKHTPNSAAKRWKEKASPDVCVCVLSFPLFVAKNKTCRRSRLGIHTRPNGTRTDRLDQQWGACDHHSRLFRRLISVVDRRITWIESVRLFVIQARASAYKVDYAARLAKEGLSNCDKENSHLLRLSACAFDPFIFCPEYLFVTNLGSTRISFLHFSLLFTLNLPSTPSNIQATWNLTRTKRSIPSCGSVMANWKIVIIIIMLFECLFKRERQRRREQEKQKMRCK